MSKEQKDIDGRIACIKKMATPGFRIDLIPLDVLAEVARVMEFGALKHKDDLYDTLTCPKPKIEAAERHRTRFVDGLMADEDTGESHLAHAAANDLIALSIHRRTQIGNTG